MGAGFVGWRRDGDTEDRAEKPARAVTLAEAAALVLDVLLVAAVLVSGAPPMFAASVLSALLVAVVLLAGLLLVVSALLVAAGVVPVVAVPAGLVMLVGVPREGFVGVMRGPVRWRCGGGTPSRTRPGREGHREG
ncbi:hypothetical protein GCM10025331_59090 [Actinoplanes utahensis]|nr:hypothetical protein Aut01nite_70210 [Actinoplanes utahensis]